MPQPTVYFLCGLAGSGKTTLAHDLELNHGAARFTLDQRMLAKYDLKMSDEPYGELARLEKEKIWEEARLLLEEGQSVVLDWSMWSRRARAEWSQRAQEAGYPCKLFFLQAEIGVLKRRLQHRNSVPSDTVHYIPLDELERFSHIFEAPVAEEGLVMETLDAVDSQPSVS